MTKLLYDRVRQNPHVDAVLEFTSQYKAEKLYIGAGALVQTVWNHLFGNAPDYGIDDIDIVYCNPHDLNTESENLVINTLQSELQRIPIRLDIKNQARVHLWYKNKFGFDFAAVSTLEQAVDCWPTTATSIVLRLNNRIPESYAPFGLDDLFAGIIRPNKIQITKEIYQSKVNKWLKKWPLLKVIPWD